MIREMYTSKSRQAGRRAAQLRKAGFTVSVSSLGYQIGYGTLSMVSAIGNGQLPSKAEIGVVEAKREDDGYDPHYD